MKLSTIPKAWKDLDAKEKLRNQLRGTELRGTERDYIGLDDIANECGIFNPPDPFGQQWTRDQKKLGNLAIQLVEQAMVANNSAVPLTYFLIATVSEKLIYCLNGRSQLTVRGYFEALKHAYHYVRVENGDIVDAFLVDGIPLKFD